MDTLLMTKLYIPRLRPQLVPRPRLLEKLEQGLWSRVTLISAPPGFGKSTLISAWAQQQSRPVAWLSLDEQDNVPARFLSYLVAALQTIRAEVGQKLQAGLEAPTLPPVERLLPPLINDLATLTTDSILVLDDYHLIQNNTVHAALIFLIDYLPPPMHLVITSRHDPPLPLARWRARGHLAEIRADDLRFAPAEMAQLFAQPARPDLTPAEVAALERQTEGWIAGLQMALLAWRSDQRSLGGEPPGLSGQHPYILDYLAEEVLHHQPPAIQHFLLRTSILDRLSGPLCEAVLDQEAEAPNREDDESNVAIFTTGQASLEYLEQANLFIIPLDDQRRWYRYHHLFADFLRSQLRKTDAAALPRLHRRAAQWYAANGPLVKALEHTLAAGDVAEAARLVEQHGELLLLKRTFGTLRDWLGVLPPDIIHARPRLVMLNFWLLLFSGRFEQAEPYVGLAETLVAEEENIAVVGRLTAIRAFLMLIRHQAAQAIELCQTMLDRMPPDDQPGRGQLTLQMGLAYEMEQDILSAERLYQAAGQTYVDQALMSLRVWVNGRLGWVQSLRGHLHRAGATYRHTLSEAGQAAAITGWVHIGLGRLLYEWNKLEEAARHFSLGLDWSRQEMDRGMALIGYVYLAWVYYAQGDSERAMDTLVEVGHWAGRNQATRSEAFVAAHQTRLRLRRGDLAGAALWEAAYRRDQADERSAPLAYTHLRELEQITLARLWLVQNKPTEALDLLNDCLTHAEDAQRQSSVIEILVVQALALERDGDPAQALAVLKRALALAEPEGYCRTFLDEDGALVPLLRRATTSGPARRYAAHLLTLTDPVDDVDALDSFKATLPPLAEPLTDRELEVLRLIAEGQTNRQIAEALVISIGTVAKHTHNIFTKLDADNRVHAVTLAQRLGLLEQDVG